MLKTLLVKTTLHPASATLLPSDHPSSSLGIPGVSLQIQEATEITPDQQDPSGNARIFLIDWSHSHTGCEIFYYYPCLKSLTYEENQALPMCPLFSGYLTFLLTCLLDQERILSGIEPMASKELIKK